MTAALRPWPALMLGVALALAGAAPACGVLAQTATPTPTPATAPGDPTRYNYPVAGTAVELLTSDDATFAAFAAKVRSDLDWTLAKSPGTDRGAQRTFLGIRMSLQALSGREDQAALETLTQIRALEDKPDAKLLTGIEMEALLKARIATGQSSGPAVAEAYGRILAASVAALSWPVVGVRLKEMRSSDQVLSEALFLGEVKAQVEPALARSRELSAPFAWALIDARAKIQLMLPLRSQTLAALSSVTAAHESAKPDIWSAREATLTAADRLTPVTVAIWDSGIDLTLFPGRVYTDPHPFPWTDPHGLAFDIDDYPTHGALLPLDAARTGQYAAMRGELKGFSDLEAAVISPESDALKTRLAGMTSDQLGGYMESLSFFAEYVHGTHVAGIAARGNPAIRLVAARLTFDWRNVPQKPTEEAFRRGAQNYFTAVNWFHDHGVRVVNMSWGETPGDIDEALEKNGEGKDFAERLAIMRKLYAIDATGLFAAIRSAPEILFICAAGNSGANSTTSAEIPAAFKLPNLLTVGAVDQAGDEASFTNYGETVVVDADGYQVESVLPGGARMRFSGTSMAAPNVVNLAAKLLALNPNLTPPQVIKLIVDGAAVSDDGRRHNINPRRSVELLRAMKHGT